MSPHSNSLETAAPEKEASLRADVTQFFVNLAQALSFPRSVGEIYGALYCSRKPLSFNDLIEKSGTSKASVSQGLRTLKNINAISVVNVANDRRTYYRAELDPQRLIGGFVNETIAPQLRRGANHIEQLDSSEPFLQQRIDGLRVWNRHARKLLSSLEQND